MNEELQRDLQFEGQTRNCS